MFIRKYTTTQRRVFISGFTLIELLVVIVIIGILATLATVALTSSRSNARDARRISDLKQISTGLELYYADNNAYPTTITFGSALVGANSKTYMAKVPTNPTPRAEGACGDNEYSYAGSTSDYSLIGCLAKATGEASAGARVLSVGGSARDLGPTNGLSSWLMLDSLSGTKNLVTGINGTITGNIVTSTGRFGESGGAYSFNGQHPLTNSTITISDSLNQALSNQQWTITAWIKLNSTLFERQNLLNFGGGIFLLYRQDDPSRQALLLLSGASYYKYGSKDIRDDTWYLITYVLSAPDNKFMMTYYNGNALTGSVSVGDALPGAIPSTWSIGNYLNGSVADLRVYNRVLSQAEIISLYNATKPN